MAEKISFQDEIQKNKIKSFFLIIIIFVFFIILGYIISAILDPSYFFVIMIVAIIFSLSYILISYYNSDKIALASVKAKPASQTTHREFYNAAENMSIASGLPMPRLYVMESHQINAFASGRDPEHAVICVTSGTLERLNKQELEGVIGHEMSHIANYDIRFMTLTAVLIGMISIIAQIFLRSLWFSSVSGNSRDRDGRVQIFLIILGIVFAILAPIAANLVSLAISRKREFGADASGIKFTRYPPGLISALKKIKSQEVSEKDKHRFPKAVAPLFISDPLKKKISGIFATHPSIEKRISKLERM
ncbi:MAG: M48 family metallopeptidase [Candidatus Pacearchaeota archaeon]|nr:M48 family metallopeptidase [Candidatus Pacearchaeota archaeon]